MSMNGATSTWGRYGLVADRNLSMIMADAARRWFLGEISLGEIRAIESTLPRRSHISLVVNNECNLKCTHCFLQIPRLSRERLTPDEWRQVIDSSCQNDVGQYVVVGKEPLLGLTGPSVIAHLGELRRQRQCVRTGLVTNGTLIHKHSALLRDSALSHMDISLDGCETDHDAIRGFGAFASVRDNINWAADLMGDHVFATMTLQKRNLSRVKQAILAFAGLGLKSVGISPYDALPYTDPTLALSPNDLRVFFGSLRELADLELPHEMFVQTDACVVEPDALFAFMNSAWFNLDVMEMDGTGFLYFRYQLRNGITLSFRFLPWPMTMTSSVRITADGDLVSIQDALRPRSSSENALANVRDFDFDFSKTFRAAARHSKSAIQDQAFESDWAPRIRAAYSRKSRFHRLEVVQAVA